MTFAKLIALFSLFPALLFSNQITHSNITDTPKMPDLSEFIQSVVNGDEDQLVGVYAEGLFAYPVVQQPEGNSAYVSETENTLTEFSMAQTVSHSTGILAHNTLAGAQFDELIEGVEIHLVYGDGDIESYTVTGFEQFQATSPRSAYSKFVSLNTQNQTFSSTDLFYHIYGEEGRLVFQTCIERGDEDSWGRLFIIAEPQP